MCAYQKAISKYVELGLDQVEAAVIVAEILAQARGKIRSASAERSARYRARKRDESVTKRDESVTEPSVTKRDESVTKRDIVTPPSLSKEDSSKKERKQERGARLPEHWKPDPPDWMLAERSLGGTAALAELEKFRDHWKQQPGSRGIKLCWDATWRNWVRRAAEYRHSKSPQKPNNPNDPKVYLA